MPKKERKLDRHRLWSLAVAAAVLMLLTYLLIALTPLRRTIPGYPSRETQLAAIENYRKIDSLEKVVNLWAFQVANIQRVATGREPLPLDSLQLATASAEPDEEDKAVFEKSDSLLRAQVELLDAGLQANSEQERIDALKSVPFKRPLKGTIKSGFTRTGSHPFIEVTAPSKTSVAAVLDGTIVSAEWSELEGCTI